MLDIPYPRLIQQVFESLKPFAGLLTEMFHLDCLGNFSFHQKWIARVFIMPLVLCSLAVVRYAYVRRRGDETVAKNAAGSLKSDAFFILFVVYRACMLTAVFVCDSLFVLGLLTPDASLCVLRVFPAGVCNQVFNIFNCRTLDSDHRVLRMDYSIECNDPNHAIYRAVAAIMIAVFAFGIPVGMSILMVSRMREYGSSDDTDRFMARRVADELKVTDVEAADAIRDVTTGREYSFLVNAYK